MRKVRDPDGVTERLLFARGVLKILKDTGLYNELVDNAIEDLNGVLKAIYPPD